MANSTVSETDLKLYLNLSNDAAAAEAPPPREGDDDDDDSVSGDEEGSESASDEEAEEGDDDDEEEAEGGVAVDDDDGAPSEASGRNGGGTRPRESAAPTVMSARDIEYEKTTVLLELDRLEGLGCRLTRRHDMSSSLEEMQYEARRHVLQLEEQSSVNTLKDGLRIFVSGVEFANGKFGPFLNLDNFSQTVNHDITAGKFNLTLAKLHRKYFRTPGDSSPEIELAFSLIGAAAFHHFQRSYVGGAMGGGGGGGGSSRSHAFAAGGRAPRRGGRATGFPPAASDDDSDEDVPPPR